MTTETEQSGGQSRLAQLPVTFFAVLMGLFGLALAVQAAVATGHGWAAPLAAPVKWAGGAALAVIAALYLLKALLHPGAVAAEWRHPVQLAFFPTITISLMLAAAAFRDSHPAAAEPMWLVGALGQGGLTVAVISGWIGRRAFEVGHLTPAWFIPTVGNAIAPVAGVSFGHVEVSWLFLSAAVVFWLVLLTLVVNRLIFHDPLPARLFPTLVILIAPPAVTFIAWTQLNGGVIDAFARLTVNTAYVFAALVAVQLPKLARLPFALSWWALSFPLAAVTIASLTYGARLASPVHDAIGLAGLALLAAVVAGLALRTMLAVVRGEICRPEPGRPADQGISRRT